MIRTLSQTEAARRDTIFSRADGVALDRISARLLNVTRPHTYPRDAWAKMLEAFVYQPRGTFRCLFGVLDALFRPWADLTVIENLSINSDGEFNSTDLLAAHGGRWAWYTSDTDGSQKLVYLEYAYLSSGRLSTVESGYWDAWSGTDTGSLRFVPFVLTEADCLITLWLDAELLSAPPSYLQSPDGSARPANQPYGGHLLNLFDLDPDTLDYGDQTDGPFPLYLTGEDTAGLIGHLMRRLLVAGVHMVVRLADFGDTLGYGPIFSLPRYGRIGPPNLGI